MDPTLVLSVNLDSSASRECSGVPKFSGVSEISDLRQDKAENSNEIWKLQFVWKGIFIYAHWVFVLKLVL